MDKELAFIGASRAGDVYGEFTKAVQAYRHEWQHGPYKASWRFEVGDGIVKKSDLQHWFNDRLMSQISTHYKGAEVWRGFIGKMIMNLDGQMVTQDVMQMKNAVKCSFKYTDANDLISTGWTAWHANLDSLERYGNFEYALNLNLKPDQIMDIVDGQALGRREDPGHPTRPSAPITEPDARADWEVAHYSTPLVDWGPGDPDRDYIEFTAYGAMALADKILLSDGPFAYFIDVLPWQLDDIISTNANELRQVAADSDYADTEYGDEITVTNEILRLLDVIAYQAELYGSDQLLFAREIAENNRLTVAGVASPVGVMTRLNELAKLRDLNNEYYEIRIDCDGGVTYAPVSTTPVYNLYPAPRGLKIGSGDVTPTWDARPELIRVMDTSMVHHLPDTAYGDGALRKQERVTMRDGGNAADFGSAKFNRQQYEAALRANKMRVKRAKK